MLLIGFSLIDEASVGVDSASHSLTLYQQIKCRFQSQCVTFSDMGDDIILSRGHHL